MSKTQLKIIGVYALPDVEQFSEAHARLAVGTDMHGALFPPESVDNQAFHDAKKKFRSILGKTVVVEMEVLNCQAGFDDSVLHQPGGARYEDHYLGSCFDVCYLSLDGNSVIGDSIGSLPANTREFRVACYQYLWNEDLPIHTPYGEFRCPPPTVMPERISRVAPYFVGD